ncbi:MAG: hypothetical protein HW421_1286 [Ignavibacteria bacterium]|nr:hypothetical protein [Ignavibacteria bacterium]
MLMRISIIIFILTFACSSDVIIDNEPEQFFPMELGKSWTYTVEATDSTGKKIAYDDISDSGSLFTMIIDKDTSINGVWWYGMPSFTERGTYCFYNNQNDGIRVFQQSSLGSSSPALYFKYPVEDGASYKIYDSILVDVNGLNNSIEVPRGKYVCIKYSFKNQLNSSFNEENYYISVLFGIIKYENLFNIKKNNKLEKIKITWELFNYKQ